MSTPLRHVKLISFSPTHRVSVLPYIDSHSRFHKRESMSDEIRQSHDRQPRPSTPPRRSAQRKDWQGQPGLNRRPAVLETAALPTELYPLIIPATHRAAGTRGLIFNLRGNDKHYSRQKIPAPDFLP